MLKKSFILALICFSATAVPVEFVIVVTSYNNESYVERNLNSLFCQKSTLPFQVIYVNDCSTDKTGTLVESYAKKNKLSKDQLKIIHNKKNLGSGVANIYHVVHTYIEDHKVVVCVDGDDFLSFSGVLLRLEKEYTDPSVWMTYGRFVVYPEGEIWSACQGYPEDVIQDGNFRNHPNVPSHIKTFRSKLFKEINHQSLLDQTGKFYAKAWDMAMLFPMLEMSAPYENSGINHSRYIEDTILYIYNFSNPLGDAHTNKGRLEQIELDQSIRSQKKYDPLKKLFDNE